MDSKAVFPVAPDALYVASDSELRAAVDAAEILPLLCTLAILTDDPVLLDQKFRPNNVIPPEGPVPNGGLSDELVAEARGRAYEKLRRLRDAGALARRHITRDTLEKTIAFATNNRHGPLRELVSRELDIPHDVAAPDWRIDDLAPGRNFRVAIIGAGMSGILCAHRMRQAGIDVAVFEKNRDVGGTWYENSYPGCRLDTPNFAYSFSFAQNPGWPSEFSQRDAILEYFNTLADRLGVRESIRLQTEVLSATYDADRGKWTLRVRDSKGSVSEVAYDVVISAVGQLNRPNLPDIPGIDSFQGASWHTGEWNHQVDLQGKRVGVVGTGASAYQVIPAIVLKVASLTVFQRTPPWMLPTPQYYDSIAPRTAGYWLRCRTTRPGTGSSRSG